MPAAIEKDKTGVAEENNKGQVAVGTGGNSLHIFFIIFGVVGLLVAIAFGAWRAINMTFTDPNYKVFAWYVTLLYSQILITQVRACPLFG